MTRFDVSHIYDMYIIIICIYIIHMSVYLYIYMYIKYEDTFFNFGRYPVHEL